MQKKTSRNSENILIPNCKFIFTINKSFSQVLIFFLIIVLNSFRVFRPGFVILKLAVSMWMK